MKDFLLGRVRLVREMMESEIDVHYADLALILCSVISACSAIRWPGRGIDRCRYVELLACHSPTDAHASWVSVPALIDRELVAEGDTPYKGNETRIFRDEEIDLEIAAAQRQYPCVTMRNLKRCSYANLIYEWLRCGYAHGYWHNENVTHVPASRHDARISYIGRSIGNGTRRMVAFHIDYLIGLAEHHATNLVDSPQAHPATWWLLDS